MPLYEYECTPCLVVYETMHGMNDPAPDQCPKCGGSLRRKISAPRINRYNYSSPTEAKYAKVSAREEIAKETGATEGIRAHLAPAASPAQPLGLADFGSDRPCITEVRFIERGILK
jgi:putative FmdB family regulatory protein